MGAWALLAEDSQVPAVHAALLPTGEVVYYSGNTGQEHPAEARVWSPTTSSVRTPRNAPSTDLFCSGLSLTFDGRLFVAGGTAKYSTGPGDPWFGSQAAYLFEPEQGWERVPDMSFGRWYPSVICLPDGRMMVVSGEGADGARTQQVEVFDIQSRQWEVLPESANRLLPLFPRLHVLPSGAVACAGEGAATAILNLGTMEWTELAPAPAPAPLVAVSTPPTSEPSHVHTGPSKHEHPVDSLGERQYDLAVLVGPAGNANVLNAGGGSPATDSAQIMDFNQPAPAWRAITPMPSVRWFPNSALLPDGTLFIVGGGHAAEVDAILEPVIFNPADESWTPDAPMQVERLYHSTAVLLPDGRVWVAGTDLEVRMELYSPNYLQLGPRPAIVSAPATITYNQTFPVTLLDGESGVGSVSFIRLSAVTHAYNSAQRYVPLEFDAQALPEISVSAPGDPNVAPPGHYMLFVTSQAGAPAVAPIVQLVFT